MTSYRVVGEMGAFTTNTPAGLMKVTVMKRGPVPADAKPEEIRHHLAMGLIRPVAGAVPEPVASVGAEGDPAAETELSDERRDARAKLKADGSAPHPNAAEAVWVEFAVARGYDYDAAKAAGKAELIKLLKQN